MAGRSGYSKSKDEMIATRVTPRIKNIIINISSREGLNVSEWLRYLIIAELRRNEALPELRNETI